MLSRTRLLFSDGRIAEITKVTSPVVIVLIGSTRHMFAQDITGRFYLEVSGHHIPEDELDWVQ